jgi:hypothetical protein
MQGDPLGFLPVWAVFIVNLMLVLFSIEAGYRWARHKQKDSKNEKEAPVGAIVGATLGLLAFLLTFTFGTAADRFNARRQLLVAEVNAIGTVYLRAELLPEPHRNEVRKLLREYVDERLQWAGVKNIHASRSSAELHRQLWAQAVAVGAQRPGSVVVALFIDSVNEVIDLHTNRAVARQLSRIPGTFWIVLYVVAFLALSAMGYHGGVAETSRSPAMLAVAIAFSAVIVLIVDLDRPGEGAINVSQRAMMVLRDSFTEAQP